MAQSTGTPTRAPAARLAGRVAVVTGASRGITVNVVRPGPVETDMFGALADAAFRAHAVARTPLGRLGRPEDVAAAVSFFASNDAAFVTGQALTVSGGVRL